MKHSKNNSNLIFSNSIVADGGGPLLICNIDDALAWQGESGNSVDTKSKYNIRCEGFELILREIIKNRPNFSFTQTHDSAQSVKAFLEDLHSHIINVIPNATTRKPEPSLPTKVLTAYNKAVSQIQQQRQIQETDDFDVVYYSESAPIFRCEVRKETDFFRAHSKLGSSESDLAAISIQTSDPCIVWSIHGAGHINVGLSPFKDQVVFLKTWVNKNEDLVEIQAYVSRCEGKKSAHNFFVSSKNKIVALWSPMDGRKIEKSVDDYGPISWPGFSHAGLIFELKSGNYNIFCGDHEATRWGCHWMSMRKIDH